MQPLTERLSGLVGDNLLVIVLLGGLAVAFLLLRTSPTQVASFQALQASLRDGQPTVVEFYSNA